MPLILLKYFMKRWMVPVFGGLLFYGGLLMAFEMVGVSKEIFSAGAPFRWLVPMLLLAMPDNLGLVLPMAAVLGGLLGTQHLTEGSEMVAAQGLGVGLRALLKPWLLLAGLLLVLATLNAHLVIPWANRTQERTQGVMLEEARTRFLRPGSPPLFPKSTPQAGVWMGPDGQVHLMEVATDRVQHLVAKNLTWSQRSQGLEVPQISLHLEDLRGAVLHKTDGSVGLIQEKEHTYTIDVPPLPRLLRSTQARFKSTPELLKLKTPAAFVELNRRITLPLASCALLLLGIALGMGHPRFKQGGTIVKSLGVIILYYLLMKYLESKALLPNAQQGLVNLGLFLLPWVFLAAGFALLIYKLRPHHANRLGNLALVRALNRLAGKEWLVLCGLCGRWVLQPLAALRAFLGSLSRKGRGGQRQILGIWTRRLWLRNWGGVLATFLALSLLIEYANLAGDLVANHASLWIFLQYWVWNLPPFLSVVLPLAFLLGCVLTLADAAMSQEWVALRAGGTSLMQWGASAFAAWGSVLLLTFILQAFGGPAAYQRADPLYRRILGRPPRTVQAAPWLNLGSTGVVWYLDGQQRWGFPLKPVGEAPALLGWEMGARQATALPWDALALVPGPLAVDLFPDRALRESASVGATPTLDLFRWQKWAPNPERATLLWTRILTFLAGPCLLFAALPFAFPSPRGGRGQALGYSLVVGLVYMGMQALFNGAAKAGEFPAFWGVLCPMLLLLGFGMLNVHRLRT